MKKLSKDTYQLLEFPVGLKERYENDIDFQLMFYALLLKSAAGMDEVKNHYRTIQNLLHEDKENNYQRDTDFAIQLHAILLDTALLLRDIDEAKHHYHIIQELEDFREGLMEAFNPGKEKPARITKPSSEASVKAKKKRGRKKKNEQKKAEEVEDEVLEEMTVYIRDSNGKIVAVGTSIPRRIYPTYPTE